MACHPLGLWEEADKDYGESARVGQGLKEEVGDRRERLVGALGETVFGARETAPLSGVRRPKRPPVVRWNCHRRLGPRRLLVGAMQEIVLFPMEIVVLSRTRGPGRPK